MKYLTEGLVNDGAALLFYEGDKLKAFLEHLEETTDVLNMREVKTCQ